MDRQDDTVPPHVLLPWGRYITTALAGFTALILLVATVYAAGSAINAKADYSEVEKIRDQQSSIKEDIAEIKTDIAMIKLWLQPPGWK